MGDPHGMGGGGAMRGVWGGTWGGVWGIMEYEGTDGGIGRVMGGVYGV